MHDQVIERDRAAQARQVGGDAAGEIAAIEIVEPRFAQLMQRGGQAWLNQAFAGHRHTPAGQEDVGEAGLMRQFVPLGTDRPIQAGGDRHTSYCIVDRVGEQARERHLATQLPCLTEGQFPARYRSGYGQGGQRAA